jgi:group I intron endonuclease
MRQGIIYLIENKCNGNKYVGQTLMPLNKRWASHIQESKVYSERPLYRAISKYGLNNFKIKVIEETTEDKLSEREIYWIEHLNTYNCGYNATTGGERSYTYREDVKEKISQFMSNVERSDEWKNNSISGVRDKVKRGERWGFMLAEHRGSGNHFKTKVRGTHSQTGEIVEFDSLKEAADKLHLKTGNLSRAIKERWTTGGYKWEKLEEVKLKRAVIGVDKNTGERLYEAESIRGAVRLFLDKENTRGDAIRKSLKNPGKYTWKGCHWYYLDEVE